MTLEIYEGINATQQYMKNAMVPEQKNQQLLYIMKRTHVSKCPCLVCGVSLKAQPNSKT